MTDRSGTAEEGFSTLETVVAFTILSLVLGAASQSIALSARSLVRARQSSEASEQAREIVARETIFLASHPDEIAGDEKGDGWTVQRKLVQEGKRDFAALRITIGHAGAGETFVTLLPVPQVQP